jgi:catechol 2,3-dioxygenase-like lactoylglutathione lyase family enzyme
MTDPNFIILYVDSPPASAAFYADLLARQPVESGDTFALFVLAGGLKLGLWSRHTVEPAARATGGGVEVCFPLESDADVDALHADWAGRGLPILQAPTDLDFGHTFVAQDPDGHRLRAFHLHG